MKMYGGRIIPYGRSAFVPLPYDGHTLFCYAKGIFAVKK